MNLPAPKTQRNEVLYLLMLNFLENQKTLFTKTKGISRIDFFNKAYILNITAVIDVLRNKKNIPINTKQIERKNKFKRVCVFVEYYLKDYNAFKKALDTYLKDNK